MQINNYVFIESDDRTTIRWSGTMLDFTDVKDKSITSAPMHAIYLLDDDYPIYLKLYKKWLLLKLSADAGNKQELKVLRNKMDMYIKKAKEQLETEDNKFIENLFSMR